MTRFEDSDAFDELERLVLRFAVALTTTPSHVSDELFAALRKHFDDPQLGELAAGVAWENYRARFDRAFDLHAQGFSEGACCVLPERPPRSTCSLPATRPRRCPARRCASRGRPLVRACAGYA